MKEVFVDTHFFVAFLSKRDQLHQRAVDEANRAVRARLVTTDFVFAELLNFFAEYGEALRAAAVQIVEQWHGDASLVVVPASRVSFLAALVRYLVRYKERGDKGYSLTDCHSMLVMAERGITEALTHDEHFEQAGFRALLRDKA